METKTPTIVNKIKEACHFLNRIDEFSLRVEYDERTIVDQIYGDTKRININIWNGRDLIFKESTTVSYESNYDDARELDFAGYPVCAVPGLWCEAYHDPKVPRQRVEECDGLAVGCAHADKDLRFRERAAAIVLTGHKHRAEALVLGHSLYVSPGHLKGDSSRGERPTYAVIDIAQDEVRVRIIEAIGHVVRDEIIIARDRLG